MILEELVNTRNWSILKKVAFPLKIKIKECLDSDIYTIVTHIQRYEETSPKGRSISEDLLNVTKCSKSLSISNGTLIISKMQNTWNMMSISYPKSYYHSDCILILMSFDFLA